ncbi:MAG: c-type cytochrome domain-containing protein [Longimicrobiales bacterium]|nr:c-type cytochrome domain-containing protein [Longimicrobiales bacterium]
MLLRADVIPALAVAVGVGLAMQSDVDTGAVVSDVVTSSHEPVSFSADVMPILEQYCWECHSEENTELGLRLDSYEGVMAGSDYGTVVEPGDPDGSLLVDMVEAGDMPEEGDPVPPEQLEILKTWIAEGAQNN